MEGRYASLRRSVWILGISALILAGSILDGSKLVSGWTASGSTWVAAWSGAQPTLGGVCASGTACEYADDAFLNDGPLTRVLSQSQVGPGKFSIDYTNDKIYLGD